jgi:predicted nucleic acid-binding protein
MKMIFSKEAILDFLEGKKETVDIFLKTNERYITIFDYSILLSGAYKTENINHNLYIIKKFIKENFEILEYTTKEANVFAQLRIKYQTETIYLLNASVIINNKIKYFTSNSSIYEKIKELKNFIHQKTF